VTAALLGLGRHSRPHGPALLPAAGDDDLPVAASILAESMDAADAEHLRALRSSFAAAVTAAGLDTAVGGQGGGGGG